ncbi:MAG TPA: tryptophan--tRNA ligase [Candidatus Acidoferrales bacterium]|nr:tryptophan--tRNA ligase [Candidatus Acidoferrales bacterium]
MPRRKRVLSGMRPTGPLHLGHYFGALSNWVRMQDEYDCHFFIADWHALTTHYADDTRLVPENTLAIALDWLAVGLDPRKSTLFVQSMVPEHAELHLLLSMVTPVSWLERVPTYAEQIGQLKDKDLGTYGFLGYPLLQTADIVMYDADLVPVGEDQVPHVELSREIVRKFNSLFGFEVADALFRSENLKSLLELREAVPFPPSVQDSGLPGEPTLAENRWLFKQRAAQVGFANFLEETGRNKKYFRVRPVLREPAALLTETPRFPGTDGRRMAKSYGNAIWLRDEPETIRTKVMAMLTDPQRVRRSDPGRPEVCPVFAYHKLFSTPEMITWSEQGCRTAAIGCVECKRAMADSLIRWIEPVQQRRRALEADPGRLRAILTEGSARARRAARRTMKRVREAVFGGVGRRSDPRRKAPQPARSESD